MMPAIDYFNRAHPLHGVKVRVALRARRRMFERVMALARPGPRTRVLDVGATPDLEIPYNNFFERWYPFPARLTACSVEDCASLEAVFPGLRFVRTASDRLPFEDRAFDLAVCFAVLEHAGPSERQRRLLGECARVADEVVAYTPYRYFPIEMHTLLPITHWLPTRWYRALWRRAGLGRWASEDHLNLLGLRDVRRLLPPGGRSGVRLLRTLGWPSNIEIHWRRAVPGTPA